MRKIIIASGGFDPIHIGHIKYLKNAKELGDELIVILNSDDFLQQKKGYIFMDYSQRYEILTAIKYVDCVIQCIDTDNTVNATLRYLNSIKDADDKLIFAKGGDRTPDNIPETETCKELGIEIIAKVGGDKIQSSSKLIENIRRQ